LRDDSVEWQLALTVDRHAPKPLFTLKRDDRGILPAVDIARRNHRPSAAFDVD
jgi:hypothetical protein